MRFTERTRDEPPGADCYSYIDVGALMVGDNSMLTPACWCLLICTFTRVCN